MPLDSPAADRPVDPRDQPRTLADARSMRAIAHPTRLALLEQLTRHDQLTATEAAALVGESPTNCAFHLRTLAKYGFVEEAGPAAGRRRPWRRSHLGFSFDDHGGTDAETDQAARTLADLLWDGWLNRLRTVRNGRHGYPEPWLDVTSGSQYLAYLTPAEAQGFAEQLRGVLDRYRDRSVHPELRPAGALAVEYLLFHYPQDAVGTDPSPRPAEGSDAAVDPADPA